VAVKQKTQSRRTNKRRRQITYFPRHLAVENSLVFCSEKASTHVTLILLFSPESGAHNIISCGYDKERFITGLE
jgi:hypothetical protein